MDRVKRIILMLDHSRAAERGLIRGITEYAHSRGSWAFYRYSPRFRTPPFTHSPTDNIFDRLHKLDADGIIGYLPAEKKLVAAILQRKFPAICLPIQAPIDGMVNIHEDPAVGALGAEHFLEKGLENFAFCPTNDHWSRVRRNGFAQKIHEAGFTTRIYPLSRERKRIDLELNRMADWLKTLPKPVGIMASNDERAAELIQASHLADLRVPDEVSILGVDDDEMICGLSNPPLSSIRLNFEHVGYLAARNIEDLIARRTPSHPELTLQATGVTTRLSTDILAITDAEVADAVRFIHRNARRYLDVHDVVNHSNLSIRALQRRFRLTLGRGINDVIHRARVREFAHLLLHTNLTVYQIAHELEFNDVAHTSRLFKKETGKTPAQYRRALAPTSH